MPLPPGHAFFRHSPDGAQRRRLDDLEQAALNQLLDEGYFAIGEDGFAALTPKGEEWLRERRQRRDPHA